ncbi:MAG TPA: Gfo/Idh/MocA family oxidoreductase, partial [Anaerolineales bacterium]|nr:Gfo/Idh/MocA family oxidoreductase [Anaerolineales bacterium]
HVLNLHRALGSARVAAVYDLNQDRAQQVAGMCGQALVIDDPERLINDPHVDAVVIASPDDTHARLTLACLQAGKPVLTEKPLATTVEDAVRVLEAEVALGQHLISVGYMRRFDPQHMAVKTIVAEGALGRPLLFKGVHRNATVPYGTTGETILINSAGHDFDSTRWLLDEEVQEVFVRGLRSRADLHPDTKDLLLIEMALTNDSLAALEVYVNADYGYEVSAEVVCQRGSAITTLADDVLLRSNAQRAHPLPKDWLARFQNAYVLEVAEWVESIQNGRPFRGASTWDGYMTMLITSSCIDSYHSGGVVSLKIPDKPELYQ